MKTFMYNIKQNSTQFLFFAPKAIRNLNYEFAFYEQNDMALWKKLLAEKFNIR